MGRWPAPADAATILVDSRDPQRIFAAGSGGLFRSADAGRTWEAVKVRPVPGGFVALAQDPRRATKLVAVAVSGGLFRSFDNGVTWHIAR